MIRIDFTAADRQALHYERFQHPHPRVQQKMEALLLKSHDLPHAKIRSILQISEGTLCSYLRAYQEGGIEKLKALSWHGSDSELAGHHDTLKNFFCNIRLQLWPKPHTKSPN